MGVGKAAALRTYEDGKVAADLYISGRREADNTLRVKPGFLPALDMLDMQKVYRITVHPVDPEENRIELVVAGKRIVGLMNIRRLLDKTSMEYEKILRREMARRSCPQWVYRREHGINSELPEQASEGFG